MHGTYQLPSCLHKISGIENRAVEITSYCFESALNWGSFIHLPWSQKANEKPTWERQSITKNILHHQIKISAIKNMRFNTYKRPLTCEIWNRNFFSSFVTKYLSRRFFNRARIVRDLFSEVLKMNPTWGHSNSTFVRGEGEGSAKNEQSILNLKFFVPKKQTRGEGDQKLNIIRRTLPKASCLQLQA